MLLSALPLTIKAQDYTCTTNNGAITITGYTGPGGLVHIPDTISGLPVNTIGSDAFYGCTNLTGVTIPNSVTQIAEMAFLGCTGLSNVTVPNNVASIGALAFAFCPGLTSVTVLSSSPNLGDYAFASCTNLTAIYFAGHAPVPGAGVFYGDNNATVCYVPHTYGWGPTFAGRPTALWDPQNQGYIYELNDDTITITRYTGPGGDVVIPATIVRLPVVSIGHSAFFRCSSLGSVTIPNTVISIGETAFAWCSSLTNVTLPSSVINLQAGVFVGCTSLSAIPVDTANPVYSSLNGVLFNKSQTILLQCPEALAGSYSIPSTVTSIGGVGVRIRSQPDECQHP